MIHSFQNKIGSHLLEKKKKDGSKRRKLKKDQREVLRAHQKRQTQELDTDLWSEQWEKFVFLMATVRKGSHYNER